MKRIYTIKDVKQMLESKGYNWSGNFYDKRCTRPMTNEDLWNNDNFELGTDHNNIKTLRIFIINEFEFIKGHAIVEAYNWSNEWQQLLLDKYPQYAQMLIEYAEKGIQKTETNLVNETQNLIARLTRLKQHADTQKEKYQQIKKLAEEQKIKNDAKREKYDVDYIRPYLTEDIDD